ncbi:MAG: sulfotransferase family protein, partial [bacterium]|nr:sulfotransferase family protein [bacterium]
TGIKKSVHVITSNKISDHWKERCLPSYSIIILASSFKLLAAFCTLFIPFGALALFFQSSEFDLVSKSLTLEGMAVSTLSALLTFTSLTYFCKQPSTQGYSSASKLLHQLVLSHPAIGQLLFEIESNFNKKQAAEQQDKQHVFVSGLARAGTTILMREIYNSGQFSSLTYNDMPFVLAPNLWQKLRGKTEKGEFKERHHGDGILENYDSPEALEEVYWRTFNSDRNEAKHVLTKDVVEPSTLQSFAEYIALIKLCHKNARYLSKNNNNTLRLEALASHFDSAVFLVPFRSPIQQALSLKRQHSLLSSSQAEDPFVRKYMKWLSHSEFGLDKKRMNPEGVAFSYEDKEDLNYWLEEWIAVYSYILDISDHHGSILPISYELLCEETEIYWPQLLNKLNLVTSTYPKLSLSSTPTEMAVDAKLLKKAEEVYFQLNDTFKQKLA